MNPNLTVRSISSVAIKTTCLEVHLDRLPEREQGYQAASPRLKNWCSEVCCGGVCAVKRLYQYYYQHY
jgi:hypothetical protein